MHSNRRPQQSNSHALAVSPDHDVGRGPRRPRPDARFVAVDVADVTRDWREEIIVLNGGELRIYENPARNPAPARPPLWNQDH